MKYLISSILFLFCLFSIAQHMPINTQYMYQGLLVNPAITGSREDLYTSFTHRKQWLGNNLTPVSTFLSIHTPLKNEKIALGAQVHRQEFNRLTNFGFSSLASYRIAFSSHRKLSFGLKLGVKQNNYNWSELFLNDDQDPTFMNQQNSLSPDVGFGTYYRSNRFYIGLAVPQINSSIAGKSKPTATWNKTFVTGMTFKISDKVDILPNLLIRKIGVVKAQTDLTTILRLNKVLDLGLIIRSGGKIVGGSVDYSINHKLQLGYSFDSGIGNNRLNETIGNHEMSISYEFKEISNTPNTKFF